MSLWHKTKKIINAMLILPTSEFIDKISKIRSKHPPSYLFPLFIRLNSCRQMLAILFLILISDMQYNTLKAFRTAYLKTRGSFEEGRTSHAYTQLIVTFYIFCQNYLENKILIPVVIKNIIICNQDLLIVIQQFPYNHRHDKNKTIIQLLFYK